jgi:hypothetical protein
MAKPLPLDRSDRLQANIDRPYATAEVHAKAYANLRRWAALGKLPPVEGGSGNPLNDYVDILGIKI